MAFIGIYSAARHPGIGKIWGLVPTLDPKSPSDITPNKPTWILGRLVSLKRIVEGHWGDRSMRKWWFCVMDTAGVVLAGRGFWPTLSSQAGLRRCCMGHVAMIFHSRNISLMKRMSIWSCPNSNMATTFVATLQQPNFPKVGKYTGRLPAFIPQNPGDISPWTGIPEGWID